MDDPKISASWTSPTRHVASTFPKIMALVFTLVTSSSIVRELFSFATFVVIICPYSMMTIYSAKIMIYV